MTRAYRLILGYFKKCLWQIHVQIRSLRLITFQLTRLKSIKIALCKVKAIKHIKTKQNVCRK